MDDNKIIYEKKVKLSDIALFKLKTVDTGKDKYETFGTVMYVNGRQIDLEPVVSSKNACYIWEKGCIYRLLEDNSIDKKVFYVNQRTNKEVNLSHQKKWEIMFDANFNNTSIRFQKIESLKNNNKLLINSHFRGMGLVEDYYFLNNVGDIYYISSRILSTPRRYEVFENVTWNENDICFYRRTGDKLIDITRVYDISSGIPKMYSLNNKDKEYSKTRKK